MRLLVSTAALPIRDGARLQRKRAKKSPIPSRPTSNQFERASVLIRAVCGLAGSMSFLDEIDAEIREAGLGKAVAGGHTPPVFDWLLSTFSYQGISDRVARSYMEKHGTASWSEIEAALRLPPSCGKLRNYWTYEGCRYDKGSFTC